VKGFLDANSKTKLKRMKKHYPKVPLRLVMGDEIKRIHALYRQHLPVWEY